MKFFKDFNLDEVLYHDAIKYATKKGNASYIDVMFDAKKQIESYLVKKAKDDIDIEILLLDRYKCALAVLASIYELDMNTAKKIYELSVEEVFENYDSEKLLVQNISSIMVKKAKEMGYVSLKVQKKIEEEKEEIIENVIEEVPEEKEENEIEEETINYEENIDILDYIDKEYLLSILNSKLNNYEYSVSKLLFGANGTMYSVKTVSKVLDVDVKKITEIYVKCLETIKDEYLNWYEGQMELRYTNMN